MAMLSVSFSETTRIQCNSQKTLGHSRQQTALHWLLAMKHLEKT